MATLTSLLQAARKTPEFHRAKRLLQSDYQLLRRLVRARIDAGLNQRELGERMGVTQQAVSKIESLEADPRLSTIRRYANAVGVMIEHVVIPDDGTDYGSPRAITHVGPAEVPLFSLGKRPTLSTVAGPANAKRTDFALSA